MAHIVLSQIAQSTALSLANHYDQLFIHGPAFASASNSSIIVTSPCCGPSGSDMPAQYTADGEGLFPDIQWQPSSLDQLVEYLLVIEDPDAPLPEPVVHGIYYDIPSSEHGITNDDLLPNHDAKFDNVVQGGFRYGKNYRDNIYLAPSPPPGTPHRYFYEVVALKERLGLDSLGSRPSKEELAQAIVGKVAGWGAWMGVVERK
ncbi:Phosphatidylethanolamine-binding protein [Aspergillus sclerotialis]|uniref:Phosphatidylethanolamine-binding protein n=1 Tax=Aspergillus sclerotialis TaxID=2070753 RepID=A0A3A3AE38_9EURO|nr:Phosphatidylethanolamine-binding protein [Aspergillus sclerotialis]